MNSCRDPHNSHQEGWRYLGTLQTTLKADGPEVENAQAATRFVILSVASAEEGMREMRKDDCALYLPLRRPEIHLSPSKAAFLSQLAFSYFIIPGFIHLDVGFWEARPAQPELKHKPISGTAATQMAGPQISPPGTCGSQKITPTQPLMAKTGIER